jgi:hypothetical protein
MSLRRWRACRRRRRGFWRWSLLLFVRVLLVIAGEGKRNQRQACDRECQGKRATAIHSGPPWDGPSWGYRALASLDRASSDATGRIICPVRRSVKRRTSQPGRGGDHHRDTKHIAVWPQPKPKPKPLRHRDRRGSQRPGGSRIFAPREESSKPFSVISVTSVTLCFGLVLVAASRAVSRWSWFWLRRAATCLRGGSPARLQSTAAFVTSRFRGPHSARRATL